MRCEMCDKFTDALYLFYKGEPLPIELYASWLRNNAPMKWGSVYNFQACKECSDELDRKNVGLNSKMFSVSIDGTEEIKRIDNEKGRSSVGRAPDS